VGWRVFRTQHNGLETLIVLSNDLNLTAETRLQVVQQVFWTNRESLGRTLQDEVGIVSCEVVEKNGESDTLIVAVHVALGVGGSNELSVLVVVMGMPILFSTGKELLTQATLSGIRY